MPIALEICVDCVESALAAHRGGADRVELCSALREGGVTPSAGLIHAVRAAVPLQICVLVRPRAGDFCYSAHDFGIMRDDVHRAGDLGADAVVVGILTREGAVDVERTAELVAAARPMKVTFNRAFDVSSDLSRSLEDVITAGADRILTSGGQSLGTRGAAKLAQLGAAAKGRITLLGAGGIRHSNVREFVLASGVHEVHTSLRPHSGGASTSEGRERILMSEFGGPTQYAVKDGDVLKMRKALHEIGAARQGVLRS